MEVFIAIFLIVTFLTFVYLFVFAATLGFISDLKDKNEKAKELFCGFKPYISFCGASIIIFNDELFNQIEMDDSQKKKRHKLAVWNAYLLVVNLLVFLSIFGYLTYIL